MWLCKTTHVQKTLGIKVFDPKKDCVKKSKVSKSLVQEMKVKKYLAPKKLLYPKKITGRKSF